MLNEHRDLWFGAIRPKSRPGNFSGGGMEAFRASLSSQDTIAKVAFESP
jgi:hypothetical protein